jgi:hypothetical protein
MHVPWWVWGLLAVVLVIAVVVFSVWLYRRAVRDRFLAFLRETHPEFQVVDATLAAIAYRLPSGGDGTIFLHNLYNRVSETKSPAEERVIFGQLLAAICEQDEAAGKPLSLDECGDRLRPMLAPPAKRQQLPAGAEMPFTLVASLGLEILYVLDDEHSLCYVTELHRGELGLTVEELHARAVDNLRNTFPAEDIRRSLAKPSFSMVRLGDSYDATRLLLIPECLAPGQTVAAVIPDRDSLAFGPVAEDCDWRMFDELARTPTGPHVLLRRPVRVTAEGFELR